MIKNIPEGIINYVREDKGIESMYKHRIEICKSCEYYSRFSGGICKKCRCFLFLKVRVKSERCVLGLW